MWCALLQVSQAHRAPLFGNSQETSETFRRRYCVPRCSVPPLDLDAEMIAHRIEVTSRQVRQQPSRETDRADPRALEQQSARALDLSRHECPIEARVVCDEDAAGKHVK